MNQTVSERLAAQAATLACLLGAGIEQAWAERAAAIEAGVSAASISSLYPFTYASFEPRLLAYARLRPAELETFFEVFERLPVLSGAFSIDLSIAAFRASGLKVDKNGWPVLDELRLLERNAALSNTWQNGYGWAEMICDSTMDLIRLAWALANTHRFTEAQLERLVEGIDHLFRELDAELPGWPWLYPELYKVPRL